MKNKRLAQGLVGLALAVIIGLAVYGVTNTPVSRGAVQFPTPSSGQLTALAANEVYYQALPDGDTGVWIDYGDPELYRDFGAITAVPGIHPGWVVFRNYACFTGGECDETVARVGYSDTFDSDPRILIVQTPLYEPTVTQSPTATPSPTVTPGGYEIVETNVDVQIYFRGMGSDGTPKDLNERYTSSLYNFSDGYRLPACDFVTPAPPDKAQCAQNPTHLLYVIQITNGLPYDIGYWGAINEATWIALYIEKTDTWYTDWRPLDTLTP